MARCAWCGGTYAAQSQCTGCTALQAPPFTYPWHARHGCQRYLPSPSNHAVSCIRLTRAAAACCCRCDCHCCLAAVFRRQCSKVQAQAPTAASSNRCYSCSNLPTLHSTLTPAALVSQAIRRLHGPRLPGSTLLAPGLLRCHWLPPLRQGPLAAGLRQQMRGG